MSLEGIALVTGAGSGIGRSLSLIYARDGVSGIALVDLDSVGLKSTAQEIKKMNSNIKILELIVDVSSEEAVKEMVTKTVSELGGLHYAANLAGIGLLFMPSVQVTTQDFDKHQAVNQRGMFFCVRAELEAMLKQAPRAGSSNPNWLERGSIMNVASMAGLASVPRGSMAYTTSKHAVIGITKSAALDHAQDGIRVNAVCPGYINTPIISRMEGKMKNIGASQAELEAIHARKLDVMGRSAPMGRVGTPEEVAEVCAFLSSSKASFVTGAVYTCDGGMQSTLGLL